MIEFWGVPHFRELKQSLRCFQGNGPISVGINIGIVCYSDLVRLSESLDGFKLAWVTTDMI